MVICQKIKHIPLLSIKCAKLIYKFSSSSIGHKTGTNRDATGSSRDEAGISRDITLKSWDNAGTSTDKANTSVNIYTSSDASYFFFIFFSLKESFLYHIIIHSEPLVSLTVFLCFYVSYI